MKSVNINAEAQKKLVFRCRVNSVTGSQVRLTPVLVIKSRKKWTHFMGPGISLKKTPNFKRYVMALDNDFKLGDAVWNIRQIKFTLECTNGDAGQKVSIDIEDVRIVYGDEISGNQNAEITVVPKASPKTVVSPRAIKIFFDLDNDDLQRKIWSRTSKSKAIDNLQNRGFRDMVLQGVFDLTRIVEKPSDADVIIYARAIKSPHAAEIAAAVKAGKSLMTFGYVPDKEVTQLMPLTISTIGIDRNDFAPRKSVVVSTANHPLFSGITVNAASFGVYNSTEKITGKKLISFSDDSPVAVEGKSGAGKVISCTTGIGAALIESKEFYDAFLLRSIWYLGGKDIKTLMNREQKLTRDRQSVKQHLVDKLKSKAGISDNLIWRAGMSLDNFGRFGWLVGEGLLCDNVGNKLNVGNNIEEYRFCSPQNAEASISLEKWNMKPFSGSVTNNPKLNLKQQLYSIQWSGTGCVEYTAEFKLPADWRGKQLYFSVTDGIDDTDKVFINEKLIGSTDQDTPHYWNAPRRYKIPANQLNWKQFNKIAIQVTNLRGNAKLNSCPKIIAGQSATVNEKLTVSDLDWTHKTYLITDEKGNKRRMVLSLLIPFVLYDFDTPEIMLALDGIADSAAWMTKSGIRTADLTKGRKKLLSASNKAVWSSPWLLLWKKGECRPLLLTFEFQPEQIEVVRSGKHVNGLNICTGKSKLGRIIAGTPWGIDYVNTAAWSEKLAPAILKKIDQSVAMSLRFPLSCDEIFALDTENKRVHIINRFKYEVVDDQWQTPKPEYAVLPPMASFAKQSTDFPVGIPAGTIDFSMPTKYGPLMGLNNTSTISYNLPLPSEDTMLLPEIKAMPEIRKQINRIFAGGIRWSCGGRVSVNTWTPEKPAGNYPLRNVDMFAWNFGLGTSTQGRLALDKANLKLLSERVRKRFMEPVEYYQYKAFTRFREEPFSGIRYPVLFNSYYPNNTPYAEGFGSKVIYGDENEACTVVAWIGRQLADNWGQQSVIKANWNYFRQAMRFLLTCDDWAFHTGSCREFGNGSWIDMLNCEYPAMMQYARNAQIAGDMEAHDQGLYRAAKRMLPTLMRLHFKEYMGKHYRNVDIKSIATGTGFGETNGAHFLKYPFSSFVFYNAIELFDFSQGFPSEMLFLYKQYADKDIAEYLKKYAVKTFDNIQQRHKMREAYLLPMAFWHLPGKKLKDWALELCDYSGKKMMGDWPGIRCDFSLNSVIFSQYPDIYISRCREILLNKATYNPAKKEFSANYSSPCTTGEFRLKSSRTPVKIIHNGNKLNISDCTHADELRLPVAKGSNQLVLKLK